jgi:hypothetical protein
MSIPVARTPANRPAEPRRHPDKVVSGLVDEFLEEKREEKRQDLAEANRRNVRDRLRRPVVGAIVVALCGAAWFAPLPTRPPSPPPPLAYRLASARLALNLAARRVDAFAARHGRLPATLLDANVSEPQIILRAMGTKDYVLQLHIGSVVLTYDSSIAPAIQSDDASTILRTTLK